MVYWRITDENAREMDLKFDFLSPDVTYEAIIYEDRKDAHWNDNPTSINIRKIEITNQTNLKLKLAAGGGFAISIIKKNKPINI